MRKSILVIGGTGTIGRELLEILKRNEIPFKALVRTAEKASKLEENGISTVLGSLGDWHSVEPVLGNTDTIFLLTGVSPENIDHQNGLIDRAKDAGVRKIVKVSAVGAKSGSEINLANWHGQIEEHLKKSGLEHVILRPHSFMQNILMSLPTIKEQGAIYESIEDGKIPMIDARDVAEASYYCLTRDDFNNNTYLVTGPKAIGYSNVANSISSRTNRNVNYVQIPSEAHNQAMKAAGLPDWLADDLTKMSGKWKLSNDQPTDHFQKITGKEPRAIDQFTSDYAPYFS